MLVAVTALMISLLASADASAWTPGFEPYQAYETSSWPESVTIGDVTGDGRNDVLMTTSFYFDETNDFKLFVFPQRADGSLGVPTKLATSGQYGDSMGVAVADLDDDGALDAAVATAAGIDVFYQRNGTLAGPEPVPNSPRPARQVLVADMNSDGRTDLVVNSDAGVVVLTRTATGYVSSTISAEGVLELEHGQLNADPYPDLVGIIGQQLRLFEGTPDGSYTVRSIGLTGSPAPQGVAVADVAGADGRDDVVITRGGNRPASEVAIHSQSAAGGISGSAATYASYDIPEPIAAADMNGDARQDIVTVHGGWFRAGLYTQLASGRLSNEQLFDVPYASHYNAKGLALEDLNCDGRRDIAIADYNNGLVVLRQTPSASSAVGGACDATDPDEPPPAVTPRPAPPANQEPGAPPANQEPDAQPTGPAASGPRVTLISRWRRGDRYVRVRLACDKPCLVSGKGVVTLSRRPARGSRALRLAPALQRLGARDPRTLKLRVPARTRRAVLRGLAKGRRPTAKILVTATDDRGSTSARRISVRMRD